MERKRYRKYGACALLVLFLAVFCGFCASAENLAVVKSCRISASDRSQVNVVCTGQAGISGTDGNYYLFALAPYETGVTKSSLLLGTKTQGTSLKFTVSLNRDNRYSILYRKLVLAVRKGESYKVASNAMYIENPEILASYSYSFPKAASKKGLQVKDDMLTDAVDLSVKHAAVNICLNEFLASGKTANAASSYGYSFQGKTYWFKRSVCDALDEKVKKLTQSNIMVYGILLVQGTGSQTLIAPDARGTGKSFYGFNTMNADGVETLAALMSFLGERYMNSSKSCGRIVNWIVGNEVNNYWTYNYLGDLSFEEYIAAYTRSFRIVSTALRSVYKNARVYISLDQLWNTKQSNGKSYKAKKVLDAFAAELKSTGDINWNLAYHPYPAPLTDPKFWDDDVSWSDSTKYVTMKNIGYLTEYIEKNFRSDVRVILSEQGFTSKTNGKTNEKLQAAAFAYAYYITEFNDKIDAFIMNRQVDHVTETEQGLNLGIWTNAKGKVETASKKKVIWNTFKYIDSASSRSVTSFALSYVHASSWSSLISGFSWSKFSAMGSYKNGSVKSVTKASGTKTIKNSLKYSYTATVQKNGSSTVILPLASANRNLYQGAGWVFSPKLNFSKKTYFTCKIRITGMKGNYARVRIRFFSGKHVYETSGKVIGNKTKQISVNLSKWKYRKSVDKIQIWVRPNSKTKWKTNAKITISDMKQAKKSK